MKKILKVIEYFVYALLLCISLVVFSPRLLSRSTIQTYIVPSGSMSPLVQPGSVAFVTSSVGTSISAGDIVLFTNPVDANSSILHRVNTVSQGVIQTKGDNNQAVDGWIISPYQVKGKYLFSIPFLGYLATYSKTKLGFLLLAVVPAMYLMSLHMHEVLNGFSEVRKKYKQTKATSQSAMLLFVFAVILAGVHSNSMNVAYARLTSQASLLGITFSGGTPPPGTPVPTPTIAPSPTPTPHGDCPVDITIEGNGEGSVNTVEVTCTQTTVIFQTNDLSGTSSVHYDLKYQTKALTQVVLGDIQIDGQIALKKELYLGSCSSTGCVPDPNPKDLKLHLKFKKNR